MLRFGFRPERQPQIEHVVEHRIAEPVLLPSLSINNPSTHLSKQSRRQIFIRPGHRGPLR
jgi:hypothetical protein